MEAIGTATGAGEEHGGARPRHVRLRQGYGAATLTVDTTSFGGVPRT